MGLSIFDIAKGISWTEEGHLYLTQKESKYELLVEYLNNIGSDRIEDETQKLTNFQNILKTKDRDKIQDFILYKLEGFNNREGGYSAHIAGAHDLSPSIEYNIQNDSISIIHPNIPSLPSLSIKIDELITLIQQTYKVRQLTSII